MAVAVGLVALMGLAALGYWGSGEWRHHLQKKNIRAVSVTPLMLVNASPEPNLSFFVDDILAAENVGLIRVKPNDKEYVGVGAIPVNVYPGKHTVVARTPSGQEVGRVVLDVPSVGWHGALYAPLHAPQACFVLRVDEFTMDRPPAPRQVIAKPADADLWLLPMEVNNWFEENPRLIEFSQREKRRQHATAREMASLRAIPCDLEQ